MKLEEGIFTAFGAAFAILISITAYFIKLWIQEVDGRLEEYGKDLKTISKQIVSLESAQTTSTKNISETFRKEYASGRLPYERLDELKNEIGSLKNVLQEKVLPQMELATKGLGKVIVIEKRQDDQEIKLIKIFDIIKASILKSQDPK